MTHLDLFSGIGGFAIAAQACGYTTIGFCEREPYAQQILKERFGAVLADAECQHGRHSQRRQHGNSIERTGEGESNRIGGICCPRIHPDIFTLNGADYAGVDLLTGGFPCQPFSVAGKRLGKADDRAIWPEMLRVIREAKPTWIIGENVAGIVTMELDNILSDLEALGYSAWPLVIPACAVDARHRRDRVWIIARRSLGDSSSKGLSQRGRSERDTRNTEEGAGMVAEPERSGEDVADAASKQNNRERGDSERGRDAVGRHEQAARRRNGQADNDGTGNQGEDVAHADSQRGCVRQVYGEDASDAWESSRPRQRQNAGQLESAVCRMADGIPEGLDSGGGFCQWPEEDHETPRVTTGMKHRAHRLKGLGNSIVPQVAEEIIRAIANLR